MTCPVCKDKQSSITLICSLCQAERKGEKVNVLLHNGNVLAYNLTEIEASLASVYEIVQMTPDELRQRVQEQRARKTAK